MVLLGSPFFVLTWFMLIKLARELSGRKASNGAAVLFLSATILLATGIGYVLLKYFRTDPSGVIKYCFIILNLSYSILGAAYLLFYRGNTYITLAFIVLFFAGGAFIPLYIRYLSDHSVLYVLQGERISLDSLCLQYEISPREKDIIREICNGLSNQQIADKLFITLQTVKDHTSRIYDKTNCRSRTQLITLVNGKT
jgi:DNA-binding CsgD family transcriptional regulator